MKIKFIHFLLGLCLPLTMVSSIARGQSLPSPSDPGYSAAKAALVPPSLAPVAPYIPPPLTGLSSSDACYIGHDESYSNFAGNDDESTTLISLPFTFSLYGVTYTSCYLNNNGNITFTSPYGSFTSTGFPLSGVPMVAPFWADVDTRVGNTVKYKSEPHRFTATWPGVGYYENSVASFPMQIDTFQVILTDGTDAEIGIGNNVAFRYRQMNWTTGSASSGSGGFGGVPATVGINSGTGLYVQVGRFNENSSTYVDNVTAAGVHYLDYECFSFSVADTGNQPPSFSGGPSGGIDTIFCGSSANYYINWIGPEPGQVTNSNITYLGSSCGITTTGASGFFSVSRDTLTIAGSACNVGVHYFAVEGTDNLGATKYDTFRIVVSAFSSSASSNSPICAGGTLNLTCTDGGSGATYSWTGPGGFTSTLHNPSISGITTAGAGVYTVTISVPGGCSATSSTAVSVPVTSISGTAAICIGSTTTLTSSATSGGSWISSNTSVGTVGISTGVVTGIAAGTTTISFIGSTGCIGTKVVTVNGSPVITGASGVCVGSTTTLSSGTSGVSWASSDPTIASIGSTSGLVTGVAVGSVTISFTASTGCVGTTMLFVNPAAGAISGPTSLCAGSSIDLTISSDCGSWTSSNTAVAAVSFVPTIAAGASTTITGVAAGTAVITFTTCDGCIATYTITVNPVPAAITGTTLICAGSSATLSSATSGGMWSSSDPMVADVISVTGLVAGLTPGTSTISYTTGAECAATIEVTITAAPAAITGPTDMCIGLGIALSHSTGGGTWSSSNTGIATVTSGGVVTGVTVDIATITYALSAGCYVTKDINVNSLPAAITGATSVCFGLTTTLSSATSGGTWSSSNPSVGSINGATGVVTGVGTGAVTITYMMSTGCYRTSGFTVNAMPSAITGASSICVGSSTTLSNSSGGGMSWSSSNTAVATIGSGSGLVNGLTTGTTIISFLTTSSCYATMVLTVTAGPGTISGTATVCGSSTTTLSCTPSGGAWSSSFPAAATVNSSTGVVTGVAAGTSVITYAIGSCYATKTVTVSAAASAITGTTSFCSGATTTLNATPMGGSWTSGTTSVASFGSTSTGILTGVSAGTSIITYTAGAAGCQSFTTVSVATGPNPITGTLTVCAGSTTPLASTTAGGTWSSLSTGIATVGSSNGVVTGMGGGTSTISYNVGGCRATAVVTVTAALAAISGPGANSSVCVGQTIPFSHPVSGGTWTSSNTGLAIVGSSSGLITGVSAGTPTITYFTAPTCYKTRPVTVSGGAGAISGNNPLCLGSTMVLTPPLTGSSWSSATPAVATIGSGSGVVTGMALGTTGITYTGTANSGSCISTTIVTVIPLPTAISGTLSVCQGATTALASVGTGGGTWSSSSSVATVGSSSGVVTGATSGSGGTVIISYTWTNTCKVGATVVVNPAPPATVAITGAGAITISGAPITLTGTSGTATGSTASWSSVTPAIATITPSGAFTATLDGISVGNVTISYTLTNSCGARSVGRIFTVTTPKAGTPLTATGADVKFALYPNPTTGMVTIETPVTGVFNVYSIDGRAVSTNNVKEATTTITLPTELSAGVYMCRFVGDDGSVQVARLVVNKH